MTLFILTCVSAIVITLYLLGYIRNFGVPASISDTYYKTERKWLFPVALAVTIGTALIPMLNCTPTKYQFLSFLTLAGIMFVASAPAFREEFEGKIHFGAAILSGICATAWLICISGIPWIAIAGAIVALCQWKRKAFWIEVGLSVNMYIVLLYLTI